MPFLLFMPSFNQAHYIADAVSSVLAQDDPDWELWIVDNSTDNTPEIMRRFDDPRIQFHHISERMDPGTCLNWMLERAVGRDFSYLHTDNNLQPSYVRHMRSALREHLLGLAYCDMRVIDASGRYLHVHKRGFFDLPRLLSADTLGVPFAATVELARQVGGFSVQDVADDVRFCVGAYGLAQYVYVSKPLLDYRLHAGSRTEHAGGNNKIRRTIIDLIPKILPTLYQRGADPLLAMEQALRNSLDDVDLFIEDFWYRKLSKYTSAWWQGYPQLQYFFWSGLVNIPGFSAKFGRPPRHALIGSSETPQQLAPWARAWLRYALHKRRHKLHRLMNKSRDLLLTWGHAKLGTTFDRAKPIHVCIRSLDFRTIWAARQLELELGWQPKVHHSVHAPQWIHWDKAEGTEPLLDCATEISLSRVDQISE